MCILLQLLGLDICADTLVGDEMIRGISGGQKKRVALAQVLIAEPDLLILDEPTNGLDPMGIAEIRGLTKKIADQGKTIILASHLLDEVQKVCSHFAVLRRGVLIHSGPVNEAGSGSEIVEVNAEVDNLSEILLAFPGTSSIERENGSYRVVLRDGHKSGDINRFLFEKGVVANHLVTKRKTLEQQFLEILAES